MSTSVPIEVEDRDAATLSYTQDIRKKMVEKLTNNGTSLPSDPGEATKINAVLDSMDRQVHQTRRLDIDSRGEDNKQRENEMLAEVLKGISFANTGVAEQSKSRSIPVVEDSHGDGKPVTTVKSETLQGQETIRYEDIVKP